MAEQPTALPAYLVLDGWHGRTHQLVDVIGETPKSFRIRAVKRTKLGGRNRWLESGETTLVPQHAIETTHGEPFSWPARASQGDADGQ